MSEHIRYYGKVDAWLPDKNYGFIIPRDARLRNVDSIFVHASEVEKAGFGNKITLTPGMLVTFSVASDGRQRSYAAKVVSADGTPTTEEEPELALHTSITGTIARFFQARGFGFITTANTEVYFHAKNLIRGVDENDLQPGTTVRFKLISSEEGYCAYGVQPQSAHQVETQNLADR